jgi:hypothetical protein
MRKPLLLLAALFLLTSNAISQADPFKATGDNAGPNPFGSYNYGEFDSVDLASGSLQLSLNVAQMSARSQRSHYTLYYSSKFWSVSLAPNGPNDFFTFWNVEKNNFTITNAGQSSAVGGAGWNDSRGRLTKKASKAKCIVSGITRTVTINTNYVYQNQMSAKQNFPNWAWVSGSQYASWCGIPSTSYTTGYSSDAQGSRLVNTIVKHSSGNGEFSDTNGNVWSPYPASLSI